MPRRFASVRTLANAALAVGSIAETPDMSTMSILQRSHRCFSSSSRSRCCLKSLTTRVAVPKKMKPSTRRMAYHVPSTPSFISCAAERTADDECSSPQMIGRRSDLAAKWIANATAAHTTPASRACQSSPNMLIMKISQMPKKDIFEYRAYASIRFSMRKPAPAKTRSAARMKRGMTFNTGKPRKKSRPQKAALITDGNRRSVECVIP